MTDHRQETKPTFYPPYLFENYRNAFGSMSEEFLNLLNQQNNIFVKNFLVSSFEIQNSGIKYLRSAKGLTNNSINCTGLIKHLFYQASLAYGKQVLGSKDLMNLAQENEKFDLKLLPKEKTRQTDWERILKISKSFKLPVEENIKIRDYFKIQSLADYQKETNLKNFHPQTGDVLSYYNKSKREGHAVIVIDPLNCIAIDSSPYTFKEGVKGKIKELEGVQFRYLKFPSCNPITGEWYSWGKSSNKFQVLMRHRYFFEDGKNFLAQN
ncbi:MAG: hypothetical protein QE271_14645 [Bacteriovoracaceae bacterium]|nr:hypothetical protein [Bacteriovoracaceae bacterium]